MAHLIDKEALIAEIKHHLQFIPEHTNAFIEGEEHAYNKILSFINSQEVKEVDLEKDVRQIISLYYEGIKYYEDVIRKEREENGGSDLAIKIMDGIADARELSIQYVIDKLKAQKGEGV